MGVKVTWDYTTWLALFPEFAVVPQAQVTLLESSVVEASLIRNDGGGPVTLATTQLALLNFATAHVVFLLTRAEQAGGGGGGLVGRISSASEGSVSVSTDLTGISPNAAYWAQSQYGLTLWQMMAPYKTMRYLASPAACASPFVGASVPGIGMGWPYG